MRIEIKICGLTTIEDARFAAEQGADYLGFVLFRGSPRGLSARALGAIVAGLPAAAKCVGVFVNAQPDEVDRIAKDCRLHAVQLHGDESAEAAAGLRATVWRAVAFEAGAWVPDPASWKAARLVVDAVAPGLYGGSGQRADWDQAAALGSRYRIMLGGGLTPDNVAEAVARVRPAGVDVSSGVELAPGRKDWRKVARFVAEARRAAASCE